MKKKPWLKISLAIVAAVVGILAANGVLPPEFAGLGKLLGAGAEVSE